MYCLDIETLGVESNSVVLSCAIIHWSPDENFTYDDLVQRAVFVKFKANEQVETYGRKIDKGTIEWWEKQGDYQKKRSLKPNSVRDVGVLGGLHTLSDYVLKHKSDNNIVWTRGSLDQVCIDSLARAARVDSLFPYNAYRDVRTSIDLLCDTAKNGYCEVANVPMGFNWDKVIKHDPVHDCAADILMMRYGV